MQAALHLASPPSSSLLRSKRSTRFASSRTRTPAAFSQRSSSTTSRFPLSVKAAAAAAVDTLEVDYGSLTSSVFPAEACDTVGGEACDVEMYPEVKLQANLASTESRASSETVDREYLEYNDPKTVFPGEACDDLGGEFCEPEYQTGVY